MRHNEIGASIMTSFLPLILLGAAHTAIAQQSETPYPKMASIEEYLMADRGAEIALARSAAPETISRDATILVLGRDGFETAVEGTNGFVCMVDRGWSGPFDWPELWNPKIRAAACLNPQAVRSILPIAEMRARMVLAGSSTADIVTALEAAFESHRLPKLESGAMSYMMARSAYLTDAGEHNGAHVMFYTQVATSEDWGANVPGSPILASPYWFFSPKGERHPEGLPSMLVFLIGTSTWSDGTPATQHGG